MKIAAVAFLAVLGAGAAFALGGATTNPVAVVVSGYMKGTETVTWNPVAGATGYALYRDGVKVATAGPGAVTTRFSVQPGQHTLTVQALTETPTTTTAPTTTTTPPPALSGCFPDPVACGYPGAGVNDGVPAGTVLTPSGGLTVNTPGTVLDSLDFSGKVSIFANNVIIERSRFTIAGVAGATGVQAIGIGPGVTGVQIIDTECRSSGGVAIEACIATGPGAGWTATRVYFHGCADCVETQGVGIVNDSYLTVDQIQPNDHAEDIYVTGTGSKVTVQHSTMLNEQVQTAIVFVDNYLGAGSPASVSDSLVAGGGWTFYTSVNLSNVRMARCLTAAIPASNGGMACQLGQDHNGYWPGGGYFGPNPNCANKNATWTNVVWDDNSAPVAC